MWTFPLTVFLWRSVPVTRPCFLFPAVTDREPDTTNHAGARRRGGRRRYARGRDVHLNRLHIFEMGWTGLVSGHMVLTPKSL